MKHPLKFIPIILLVLLITACGANGTQAQEVTLSNAYTAAASTIFVQQSVATPTVTSTFLPMPTAFVFPTTDAITPTSQNVVSYSSMSTANGCNNATYISDVTITDGTVLAPGESFVKTWKFQNSGTCDWSEDYLLTFVSGNDMDGETTAIDQDVSSGGTGDLSVSLVAPSTTGTYTGYWRMADADGNVFGQSVYVMIVVSDDASTLTPTLTPTETDESSEATSTPTSTSQSTSTSTPTSVPTATSTNTSIPTDTSVP